MLIHYEIDIQHHSDEVFHLADMEGFPACSPELLERLGEVKTLQHLKRYPIIHDYEGFSWKRWLGAVGWHNYGVLRATTYDNYCFAIDAAVNGEGAIIAEPVTCQEELETKKLIPLVNNSVHIGTYRMVLIKKSPRANHFCEWLQAEMEQTKINIKPLG